MIIIVSKTPVVDGSASHDSWACCPFKQKLKGLMVTSLESMKTAANTTRAKIISVEALRRAKNSNLHVFILTEITHGKIYSDEQNTK